MALNFSSSSSNQPKPESHDDLLAALNAAMGDAVKPGGNNTKKSPKAWDKVPLTAKFWLRVVISTCIQGAAFWAVGYVLAWQNVLPFVPEWWHGVVFAAAWWLFQTVTPPQVILKLH